MVSVPLKVFFAELCVFVASWKALLEFDLHVLRRADHEERTFSLTNVAYRLRKK